MSDCGHRWTRNDLVHVCNAQTEHSGSPHACTCGASVWPTAAAGTYVLHVAAPYGPLTEQRIAASSLAEALAKAGEIPDEEWVTEGERA